MRGPEQMKTLRSNDRGPGMIDPTTKSMSCFKDPSTGSSNPEQDNHQHHPLHEVRFARKCRARRIPMVKENDKTNLYYSKRDIEAFSRDYQQEQKGLFVVFQILSGATETPALEDLW
jgi:hypothetical protein